MELDITTGGPAKQLMLEQFPGQPSRQEVGAVYGELENLFKELSEEEQAAFGALLFGSTKPPIMALKELPAEDVLKASELVSLQEIEKTDVSAARAQAASMVLVMKGTRLCNLRCTYCHAWREGPGNVMSFTVLARTIRDALLAPGIRRIEFVWHGGEVTLLGTKFLRKAIWLQQRYVKPGITVSNSVQTNAVDVSDEMMFFLRDFDISVGVSIDGPPAVNDVRRVDTEGKGTSDRILATLERFRAVGIAYGILAVVDSEIAAIPPRDLLDYFVATGARGVDLLNVLPDNDSDSCAVVGTYLPWPKFVRFMCELFDVWMITAPCFRGALMRSWRIHLI